MSEPRTIIDAQIKHLMEIIQKHREESCQTIQARADEQADAIVKRAHMQARRKMHEQNARTREYLHREALSAEARMQTRKRLSRQQNDRIMLDRGWISLRNALLACWKDATTRRQWTGNVLELARDKFVQQEWILYHPVDLDEQEKIRLQTAINGITGQAPKLNVDDGIDAGIRLCTIGACTDATIDGLLRNRTRVESLMLTAIHGEDVPENG